MVSVDENGRPLLNSAVRWLPLRAGRANAPDIAMDRRCMGHWDVEGSGGWLTVLERKGWFATGRVVRRWGR